MFKLPDEYIVEQIEKPKTAWKVPAPDIQNTDEKKHLFGIQLAKNPAFKAACEVFGEDTNTALWVSQNWVIDPIVIAARDKYLEAADTSQTVLDKTQLARKLLTMAEEKNQSNTFYLLDGKDRLKALELFADIMGYKDKKSDPSLTNNFIHNSMTIKLVEAEKKEVKTINADNEEIPNVNSPIKLKLVG